MLEQCACTAPREVHACFRSTAECIAPSSGPCTSRPTNTLNNIIKKRDYERAKGGKKKGGGEGEVSSPLDQRNSAGNVHEHC